MKLKVGDRVRVISGGEHVGEAGVVVSTDDLLCLIKHDRPVTRGHYGNGLTPGGYGYWYRHDELELIEETPTPKFKVGDRVRDTRDGTIRIVASLPGMKEYDSVGFGCPEQGFVDSNGLWEWQDNYKLISHEGEYAVETPEKDAWIKAHTKHRSPQLVVPSGFLDDIRGIQFDTVVFDEAADIIKPKKPIMKQLSNMMKKLLDGDTQKLVKAGFINGDLELTNAGREELTSILFTLHKAELVSRAHEVIEEEEKKDE